MTLPLLNNIPNWENRLTQMLLEKQAFGGALGKAIFSGGKTGLKWGAGLGAAKGATDAALSDDPNASVVKGALRGGISGGITGATLGGVVGGGRHAYKGLKSSYQNIARGAPPTNTAPTPSPSAQVTPVANTPPPTPPSRAPVPPPASALPPRPGSSVSAPPPQPNININTPPPPSTLPSFELVPPPPRGGGYSIHPNLPSSNPVANTPPSFPSVPPRGPMDQHHLLPPPSSQAIPGTTRQPLPNPSSPSSMGGLPGEGSIPRPVPTRVTTRPEPGGSIPQINIAPPGTKVTPIPGKAPPSQAAPPPTDLSQPGSIAPTGTKPPPAPTETPFETRNPLWEPGRQNLAAKNSTRTIDGEKVTLPFGGFTDDVMKGTGTTRQATTNMLEGLKPGRTRRSKGIDNSVMRRRGKTTKNSDGKNLDENLRETRQQNNMVSELEAFRTSPSSEQIARVAKEQNPYSRMIKSKVPGELPSMGINDKYLYPKTGQGPGGWLDPRTGMGRPAMSAGQDDYGTLAFLSRSPRTNIQTAAPNLKQNLMNTLRGQQ